GWPMYECLGLESDDRHAMHYSDITCCRAMADSGGSVRGANWQWASSLMRGVSAILTAANATPDDAAIPIGRRAGGCTGARARTHCVERQQIDQAKPRETWAECKYWGVR